VTLNDFERRNGPYVAEFGSFPVAFVIVIVDAHKHSATEM